jgi:hypothetical protein
MDQDHLHYSQKDTENKDRQVLFPFGHTLFLTIDCALQGMLHLENGTANYMSWQVHSDI